MSKWQYLLHLYMEKNNVSQNETARRLGANICMTSKWVRGIVAPSAAYCERILELTK